MTAGDLTTLAHPYRRKIIELLNDQGVVRIETVIDQCADDEDSERNVRATLHHNHLPKLASTDVISWNQDERTISRGSRFSEFEEGLDTVRGLVA